jgi:hypothetical protein
LPRSRNGSVWTEPDNSGGFSVSAETVARRAPERQTLGVRVAHHERWRGRSADEAWLAPDDGQMAGGAKRRGATFTGDDTKAGLELGQAVIDHRDDVVTPSRSGRVLVHEVTIASTSDRTLT